MCVHTDRLERERKNLMDILERKRYLHRRKRARTYSTGGDASRKMEDEYASYVAAQLCMRCLDKVSTRKNPMYLGSSLLLPTLANT